MLKLQWATESTCWQPSQKPVFFVTFHVLKSKQHVDEGAGAGQAVTGTRYPDLISITRTLPAKVLKISGFRVVIQGSILAFSTYDYINDARYFGPEGKDSLS